MPIALVLNTVSLFGFILSIDSLIYICFNSRHFKGKNTWKLAIFLSPIGLLLGILFGVYIIQSSKIVFATTTITLTQSMRVYVIITSASVGILLVVIPLILLYLTNQYPTSTKQRIFIIVLIIGGSLALLPRILYPIS